MTVSIIGKLQQLNLIAIGNYMPEYSTFNLIVLLIFMNVKQNILSIEQAHKRERNYYKYTVFLYIKI